MLIACPAEIYYCNHCHPLTLDLFLFQVSVITSSLHRSWLRDFQTRSCQRYVCVQSFSKPVNYDGATSLHASSVDVLVLRDSYWHEVAGNGFIFNHHFRNSTVVSVFYQSIGIERHMAHVWPSPLVPASGHYVEIQGVLLKAEHSSTTGLMASIYARIYIYKHTHNLSHVRASVAKDLPSL
jgi:hypothetical protein